MNISVFKRKWFYIVIGIIIIAYIFIAQSKVFMNDDLACKKVISQWSLYIDKQKYERAFNLWVSEKIPDASEYEKIAEGYSKSFKYFRLNKIEFVREESEKFYYGKIYNEFRIYLVYFETEFLERNYTAYEEDPVRYFIMVKEDSEWKIRDMATGL